MILNVTSLGTYSEILPLVTGGILAVVAVFVAYQGYRGHVRNGNRTLVFLVIGILFLTTVPFVVQSLIQVTGVLTSTQNALTSQLFTVFGLLLILYGFTRTGRSTRR